MTKKDLMMTVYSEADETELGLDREVVSLEVCLIME